jgi:hypothetical protein
VCGGHTSVLDRRESYSHTRCMDTQRAPWQVAFAGWILLVFAGVRLINDVAALRHAGYEATVFLLAVVGYAAVCTVAGIGLVRGRRWAWLLGVLLGLLGLYDGWLLVQSWSHLVDPRAFVLPLLFIGGIGIAILACLLSPAAIRWVWAGVVGKRLQLNPSLGPRA